MKPLKLNADAFQKLAQFTEMIKENSWEEVASKLSIPLPQARKLMVTLNDSQHELMAQTGEVDDVFQVWNWAYWCQLTHALEHMVQEATPEMKSMIVPILKQQRQHPAYPVYVQLRQRWQEIEAAAGPHLVGSVDEFTEHKIRLIEECLLEKETILIECTTGKLMTLIPCKLAYLEGELSLVAEETHDHGLLSLRLSEVQNIKRAGKIKAARANIHDVADFIRALRAMADNETRLVLKIKNPERFQLMPDYQFLGKPCLITNPEGDLIWAAWVEPGEEIFEWLMQMENYVEILEPSEFILDYAAYCEEKERKMA